MSARFALVFIYLELSLTLCFKIGASDTARTDLSGVSDARSDLTTSDLATSHHPKNSSQTDQGVTIPETLLAKSDLASVSDTERSDLVTSDPVTRDPLESSSQIDQAPTPDNLKMNASVLNGTAQELPDIGRTERSSLIEQTASGGTTPETLKINASVLNGTAQESPDLGHVCGNLNRSEECGLRHDAVCAWRVRGDRSEYRDFDNTCQLFLANLCDHPGEEYMIVALSGCALRPTRRAANDSRTTSNGSTTTTSTTAEEPPLVFQAVRSYDGHVCSLACLPAYNPECLLINKGYGKFYKYRVFMNHCLLDQYYCLYANTKEFEPPVNKPRSINRHSPISFTLCTTDRILQFARFSENLSTLGHYGWLSGDYKYSHILTPEEKQAIG